MEYKYKSRICQTDYNKLNFNPIKHHPINRDEMKYNPMANMWKHYNKGFLQQFWKVFHGMFNKLGQAYMPFPPVLRILKKVVQ